jgi:hypothetical protein
MSLGTILLIILVIAVARQALTCQGSASVKIGPSRAVETRKLNFHGTVGHEHNSDYPPAGSSVALWMFDA